MRKTLVVVKEEIRQLKLKLMELEELYRTYLYLETMSGSPTYKYCYQTSNSKINIEFQSVNDWLRAIAIHISLRKPGHGGEKSDAIIITPLYFTDAKSRENWINYESTQLRKKVRLRKVKSIK